MLACRSAFGQGVKGMKVFESLLVSGSSFHEFSNSLTAVIQTLPPEMRKRLRDIRKNYFCWYGLDELYKRLNDRTVSQIFAEYQPIDVEPIASGEVDGLRYDLYEAPPPFTSDGEDIADE
jgi:hypothetical protein